METIQRGAGIRRSLLQLAITIALFAIPHTAIAQSVMYMDESGNLHFAESQGQIPAKYRKQIYQEEIQALNKKEYNKWEQQQKKAHEKQIKETKKKLSAQAKKKEKIALKTKKKKKHKKKKGAKKGSATTPLPSNNQPVVEGGGPQLIDE